MKEGGDHHDIHEHHDVEPGLKRKYTSRKSIRYDDNESQQSGEEDANDQLETGDLGDMGSSTSMLKPNQRFKNFMGLFSNLTKH